MEFNADRSEEMIFSTKRKQPFHPLIELGSLAIVRKNVHKHFGVILDSKLKFKSQDREAYIEEENSHYNFELWMRNQK